MAKRGPKPADPTARFWHNVEQAGDCLVWTASLNKQGYGRFYVSAERPHVLAHVWNWEHERGLVPPGLELDHTCNNPPCVNPAHLEPVTHAENMRRYGMRRGLCMNNLHETTPENRMLVGSKTVCRPCREAHIKRQIERRSAIRKARQ